MPLLLVIFLVAVAGAGLAQLGEQWTLQGQREREVELLFRGQQFRAALQAYQAATPPGQPSLPTQLEQLLQDRRGAEPRHWLRQLYPDPFTGLPDWVLLRDADGRIVGLHSRSQRPALRQHALPVPAPTSEGRTPVVGDWRFEIERLATAAGARPVRPTAPGAAGLRSPGSAP